MPKLISYLGWKNKEGPYVIKTVPKNKEMSIKEVTRIFSMCLMWMQEPGVMEIKCAMGRTVTYFLPTIKRGIMALISDDDIIGDIKSEFEAVATQEELSRELDTPENIEVVNQLFESISEQFLKTYKKQKKKKGFFSRKK
ncbi:MAG: hypothetical protein ACTSUV_07275 [Candidatus Ranarchaeia archaeon]